MCGYHLQYDSLTATIPNKPKKTVDKTVANTGDTVTYTVTQSISKALDKNFYYSSLVFKDVLNSNLSYISLNVYDENNRDITATAGITTFESSSRTLKYTFSANYLKKNMSYKGQAYKFIIKAKINTNTTTGTITNTSSTIINNSYTLTSNAVSTKINYKVVAHHVDEKGKKLADSETVVGYENDKYVTKAKKIQGYELIEIPKNSQGQMKENTTVVTYRYKLKDTNVNVKYVDERGKELTNNETIKGKVFDEYKTSAKEIYGYKLIKTPSNHTGTMTEDTITVIYQYLLKDTNVIIKHVDEEGKELVNNETIQGKVFDEYKTSAKRIYGYKLIETPSNHTGTMTEDMIAVIYRYQLKNTNVITKYINEQGNEIANNETIQGRVFDKYKTSAKEIYGYKLIETPADHTGTMTEDTITVTYRYQLKDTNVIIKHVDEEGKELINNEIIQGKVFDEYKTNAKEIYGYKLIETPSNHTGTMAEDTITVTYHYQLKDTNVIIKHVDKEGKELVNNEIIQGKVFDEYKTSAKEIYGYQLIETPSNHTGTMTEDTITVIYQYQLKDTNVIIKHVDEEGKELTNNEIIKGKVFDEYKTSEKEIYGYKLIETPSNHTGTMTEDIITVTYQYRKLEFNIAVSQKLTKIILNNEPKHISNKLEIDRNANVNSLKITYNITVSNPSELEGSTVLCYDVPNGYVALEEDNLGWTVEGKLAHRNLDNLAIGETRDFTIILTATSSNIMGTVVNRVYCMNSTCTPKFEETTLKDNVDTKDFIVTISTGLEKHITEIIFIILSILVIIAIMLLIARKNKKV